MLLWGPTRISPRSLFLLRFYLQIYCLLMSVLCCGFISCTGRAHPASPKSVKLLGKYSPSNEFHFGCDKLKPNEHLQYLWVTLRSKFYPRKSSSGIIQNNNKSYAAKKILDYLGLGDSTYKSCVLHSLVLGGLLHSWILWSCCVSGKHDVIQARGHSTIGSWPKRITHLELIILTKNQHESKQTNRRYLVPDPLIQLDSYYYL